MSELKDKVLNFKRKFVLFFFFLACFQVFAQNQIRLLSWNIQNFGKTKSDVEITQIANILKDFDIVALQEVVAIDPGGAQAVAKLADELNRKGARWDYVISDPTNSPGKKTERYAFLWKTSKVKHVRRGKLWTNLPAEVYREPFQMTFKTKERQFDVLNYHARKYDDNPEIEIKTILDYLINQKGNFILLGDFNTSEANPVFNHLYAQHYVAAFQHLPTTLKMACQEGNYLNHAIDHIFYHDNFWKKIQSGNIDFVKDCDNLSLARNLSDHLPVFVVLSY